MIGVHGGIVEATLVSNGAHSHEAPVSDGVAFQTGMLDVYMSGAIYSTFFYLPLSFFLIFFFFDLFQFILSDG